MKTAVTLILTLASALTFAASVDNFSKDIQPNAESANLIALTIDYGNAQPARTIQVPFEKGQTALEILQRAVTVETHPVATHVFVTAIDGIKGERGVMAWYYQVNGQPTKKLAISNIIEEPCQIKWSYKTDVCSPKVDGKK